MMSSEDCAQGSVHASRSAPWVDHALLPIPSLAHGASAGARNRATLIVTASRQPVRRVSVPRSVVLPAQLRSLCVTECPGYGHACSACPPAMCHPPSIAGMSGLRDHQPPARHSNASCASQARRSLFQLRGGPFSATGPGMELCVVSPHQQHRPRLDASPCVVADAGQRYCRTGPGGGDETR